MPTLRDRLLNVYLLVAKEMWSERKEWIKWKWKTVKTLSTKYIETCFTSSLHVFISFKWNFRVFLSYSIQTLLFFHFISMREPNVASKLLVQFIYCLLGYSEWENAFRAPSFRGVFSMTADKRNYESLHLRSHIGSFHSRFLSFLFSSLSLSVSFFLLHPIRSSLDLFAVSFSWQA